MKLWILDADVIIDLLEWNVFETLVEICTIYVASTVVSEVKHYKRDGVKFPIDFRRRYIKSGSVTEISASIDEIKYVLSFLSPLQKEALDPGELESLAILVREDGLILCTRDAAAIRTLPFLDVTHGGGSLEILLKSSGLQRSDIKEYQTDQYFKNNIAIGQREKVYNF